MLFIEALVIITLKSIHWSLKSENGKTWEKHRKNNDIITMLNFIIIMPNLCPSVYKSQTPQP
jgi:hypothetical protein